jgi:hypothetical protein
VFIVHFTMLSISQDRSLNENDSWIREVCEKQRS